MPSPVPAAELSAPRILARGLGKRCPRCGRGSLFDGWFRSRSNCQTCGLRFEASPGSVWACWVIGDRIFVVLALLPFYLTCRCPIPISAPPSASPSSCPWS